MSKEKNISTHHEDSEEDEDSSDENEKVEESVEENEEEKVEEENGEDGDESDDESDLNPKKQLPSTPQNQQLQHSSSHKDRSTKRKSESSGQNNLFTRIWTHQDEVTLLKDLSQLKPENAADKNLFTSIKPKLSFDCTELQFRDKLKKMKAKFVSNRNKPKTKTSLAPHQLEIDILSEVVWGGAGGRAPNGSAAQLVSLGCYTQQPTNCMQQSGGSVSNGSKPILNASNPLEKTLGDMWELLPDSKRSKITTLWWKRKMSEIQIYHDQQRLESDWANGVKQVLDAP